MSLDDTLIARLHTHAPFLARALERDRDWLDQGLRFRSLAALTLATLRAPPRPAQPADPAAWMAPLRIWRRRTSLLIALADLTDAVPFPRLLGWLSLQGGLAVRAGLQAALAEAAARNRLSHARAAECGLVLYAMGKLGAGELNFSSDVDLVCFWDPALLPTRRPAQVEEDLDRLIRSFVRVLEQPTADGFVARIDLRLRPDPGATPAAVPVKMAQTYYATRGQNWERAAFIRARPIAGDHRVSAGLQPMFERWIWRRALDFNAIRDIQSIKRQISATHGHALVEIDGHNLKVGRGGIRDIELSVQTLQLIHGGRDPSLRVRRTLPALQALARAGLIAAEEASSLAEAYLHLRRWEHRLQMQEDRQTQTLPAGAALDSFALFTPEGSPESFRAALAQVLVTVDRIQSGLFASAPPLSAGGPLVFTGVEDDPATLQTLQSLGFRSPAAASALIRTWHYGRAPALRSEAARQALTELIPPLLLACGATPDPDQALIGFDQIFTQAPGSAVRPLSLLLRLPEVRQDAAQILATAPVLARLLAASPHRLDALARDGRRGAGRDPAESLARALAGAEALDEVMDGIRRWVQERHLLVGAETMAGARPAAALCQDLAATAALALDRLLGAVIADFAARHGLLPGAGSGIVILALGRFGARRPTLASDLDLILVQDPGQGESLGPQPLPAEVWGLRIARRLLNAITAQTAEGRLFQVDLRLRPDGSDGPLVRPLSGFARYYADEAWTWERMALTRAWALAGPSGLTPSVQAAIQAALTRPRDPAVILADIRDMHGRLRAAKGGQDLKLRPGGIVDLEFTIQALQLLHAPSAPQVLQPVLTEAIAALHAIGGLSEEQSLRLTRAAEVFDALKLWHSVAGADAAADACPLAALVPGESGSVGAALAMAEGAVSEAFQAVLGAPD